MGVTLLDVCRRAGVSTATVSRVLNNSPRVRPATRARVQRAMTALGYHPSHAARTLARQRSDAIGVIFPEIASGFYTEVLRGIDDIAAEHQRHLTVAFSRGPADQQALITAMLQERRVDGLILFNLGLAEPFLRDAARFGTPLVLLDRPVAGPGLTAISLDNRGGAAAGVGHLLEHGYRRIALLTGPRDNYDAAERLTGSRGAIQRRGTLTRSRRCGTGLSPAGRGEELVIWQGQFTEESGRYAISRWLEAGRALPEAIFAHNDAMALGVRAVLTERGYRVPDDVAVIGFDDIEAARFVGLTTVRVPMRAMGRAAAEAALAPRGRGRRTEPLRVLPTQLVVRSSCGCGLEHGIRENAVGTKGVQA